MIQEIVLTVEQAAPFKAQMTKNICFDARHTKSVNLNDEPIRGYPHDGGWKVPGVQGEPEEEGRYWLYITCPRCGYEWALWKLGVSQSFDPTEDPTLNPKFLGKMEKADPL